MESFKFKLSDHIDFDNMRTEYTATPTNDGNVLVTWEGSGGGAVLYTESEVSRLVNEDGYWIVI